MKTKILNLVLLLTCVCRGHSQGFVNLNFEQGYSSSNTIPGWTAYLNGNVTGVYSNDVSLSGGSVSLFSTNAPGTTPIQGKYYVFLASLNLSGFNYPVSLGQTGMIPSSAESIIFWGSIGNMQITFDGQPLSFDTVGTTPNYNVYGADVSAYAGQTGQLLFTLSPLTGNATLDNIQFSNTAVPEPSISGLSALGGLFLVCRSWQKSPKT